MSRKACSYGLVVMTTRLHRVGRGFNPRYEFEFCVMYNSEFSVWRVVLEANENPGIFFNTIDDALPGL